MMPCTGVDGDHMSLSARRGCDSEGVTTVLVLRVSPEVHWASLTVPVEEVSPEVAAVHTHSNQFYDVLEVYSTNNYTSESRMDPHLKFL